MPDSSETPLVLVSNRGPVTFGPGGEIKRGTGGLVTALIGLATYRDVTWVASAMTDEDAAVAEQHSGQPRAARRQVLPGAGRPRPDLVTWAADPGPGFVTALNGAVLTNGNG